MMALLNVIVMCDAAGHNTPRPLASGCVELVAQQQALQIFQSKHPKIFFSLSWCPHGSLDPLKHEWSTTLIYVYSIGGVRGMFSGMPIGVHTRGLHGNRCPHPGLACPSFAN